MSEESLSHEGDSIDISDDGLNNRKSKKQKGINLGKRSRSSSEVWNNFEKIKIPSTTEKNGFVLKAKCLYCKKLYSYTQGSSTSHLGRHIKKCGVYLSKMAKKQHQTLLNYAPSEAGESGSGLPVVVSPSEYNHDEVRKLLAKMIIAHEYPFRMIEHTWFNILMKYLNPAYQFTSRKTIKNECMSIFESEKESLAKILKGVDSISLTTDLWTSNQTLSYMCLVAHYIDKNWNMQCRVLNFIELDPPHTGSVIAQAVFECVTAWKIEDKIISITLDNASNNDVAVRGLKAKFAARQSTSFNARYFHVRCCAHIINLVVNDGIASISPLITNVRESVKYIKKSPLRLHKFVETCRSLALTIGEGLKLDVSTRWNSTYNMLKTAIAYREALVSYADSDANYKWEPSSEEWDLFQVIEPILESLAKVTTAFSASTYPTANIFYPHIVTVSIALKDASASSNEHLRRMGIAMMDKFNKYWAEKNNVMVIATILDPRYKMKYIDWAFHRLYDASRAQIELADVRSELERLYERYEKGERLKKTACNKSTSSSIATVGTRSLAECIEFQSWVQTSSMEPSKSELFIYLDEKLESMQDKDFNLLQWWKANACRFPIVSKMARNFLTIPATSVSSESTFSTGGRVLDDYRSSLHPATVEALVCASSWIRGSYNDSRTNDQEDVDVDVENIPFPTSVVGSNVVL